ncbi:hypothetical protein L873DRAFT_1681991 [Choiromyces venosus 120613-1]|uniref:CAP-Gly domain-containing protein n=1 Tax=Choiromyces venosus 120613-1 TaxID=1336337 RepID=A0A3N4JP72_9PEZI|nr:hypothetical protein L873DRAFT_1681991 [Choiromyces venosus 120613-1]
MSFSTVADIPVRVTSDNAASERRVTPSWTIAELKNKLEPVTGIPPSSQQLTLRVPHAPQPIPISSHDEENTQIAAFPLQPYVELHVADSRPLAARPNFVDTTGVEKYVMPEEEYDKLQDSVLAWKKRNKLGRFDPNKDEKDRMELKRQYEEVDARKIVVDARCRVGASDLDRRGTIRYVGEVDEIPNGGVWVGVETDEPTGKNDGSIQGKSYFKCEAKHGSFVRPDRIEVGDFPVIDDLGDSEEI